MKAKWWWMAGIGLALGGCSSIAPKWTATALPVERTLGPGVRLESAGKTIDEKIGHFVPCVADWNGDGKKDLIVGQLMSGKIRLYLNEGSDAAPKLGEVQFMQAGGKDISLPCG